MLVLKDGLKKREEKEKAKESKKPYGTGTYQLIAAIPSSSLGFF
jgi:hypothetical protein